MNFLYSVSVIPSKKTSLEMIGIRPVNNREIEFELVEEIISGIEDTLNILFEREPGFILESKFIIPLNRMDSPSLCSAVDFKKTKLSRKTSKKPAKIDVIEITTLHLAIISNQPTIVRHILQHLMVNKASESNIKDILTAKANITYSERNTKVHLSETRTLHGSNSFHLAVKYSPECLHSLLEFMRHRGEMKDVRLLLAEKDIHIGNTPMHIAASIPDTSSLRQLVSSGVRTNVRNNSGYTPLHIAVESKNVENATILLRNRADPNISCKIGSQNITPIQLAKTKDLIRVLLEYGADPFVTIENAGKESIATPTTLLQRLVKITQNGALEVFDDAITSNDPDINSEKLLVILDYKHFQYEGLKAEEREKLTTGEMSSLVKIFRHKVVESDEMAFHRKLLKVKAGSVLEHPLSESFLHIQWELTKPLFYINALLYVIFLIFLTALILYQTKLIRCTIHASENISVPLVNVTEFPGCLCQRNCPDVSGQDEEELDFNEEVDCYWKWELTRFNTTNHFTECHTKQELYTEYALFVISVLGWLFLCLRETIQFVSNWKGYLKDQENWAEMTLLFFSGLYLVLLFIPSIDPVIVHHLSSWSVFIAWMDVTLLMGRSPTIGTTIQMCFQVVKSVLLLLSIFLPIFLAFGFAFHVLLISNVQFESPYFAVVKVLTIMAGEFDFYDNFSYDASADDKSFGSSQLLFILAFGFVTIIIMNLLIGLTVSKLEEIASKAAVFRLGKMVELVVSSSEILNKNTAENLFSSKKIFKSFQKYLYGGRIFPLMKSYIDNSSLNPMDFISTTKVCFRPNRTKFSYKEEKHKTRFQYHSWPLYLYNEHTKDRGMQLPIALPPLIVDKLVLRLKKRDIRKREMALKRIQDERVHLNTIHHGESHEKFICKNCKNSTD